jgi:hypothetical protein
MFATAATVGEGVDGIADGDVNAVPVTDPPATGMVYEKEPMAWANALTLSCMALAKATPDVLVLVLALAVTSGAAASATAGTTELALSARNQTSAAL